MPWRGAQTVLTLLALHGLLPKQLFALWIAYVCEKENILRQVQVKSLTGPLISNHFTK